MARVRRQLGEPVERSQECRLAAARWTDQREHLAVADRQRDVLDRRRVAVEDADVIEAQALAAMGGCARDLRGAIGFLGCDAHQICCQLKVVDRQCNILAGLARGGAQLAGPCVCQAFARTHAGSDVLCRIVCLKGAMIECTQWGVAVDVARQRRAGTTKQSEQGRRALRVDPQRRAEHEDHDRRVTDDATETERRSGRDIAADTWQHNPSDCGDPRLAEGIGRLAQLPRRRNQPVAGRYVDRRQRDQRHHRPGGEERSSERATRLAVRERRKNAELEEGQPEDREHDVRRAGDHLDGRLDDP